MSVGLRLFVNWVTAKKMNLNIQKLILLFGQLVSSTYQVPSLTCVCSFCTPQNALLKGIVEYQYGAYSCFILQKKSEQSLSNVKDLSITSRLLKYVTNDHYRHFRARDQSLDSAIIALHPNLIKNYKMAAIAFNISNPMVDNASLTFFYDSMRKDNRSLKDLNISCLYWKMSPIPHLADMCHPSEVTDLHSQDMKYNIYTFTELNSEFDVYEGNTKIVSFYKPQKNASVQVNFGKLNQFLLIMSILLMYKFYFQIH